ncbi:MAG: hypothetical protein AAGH15_07040 [Myxococcota bacterium]
MRRLTAALVAAALMIPDASAGAQENAETEAPTEAELEAARARFADGVSHADAGEHEEALVAFREVLEVIAAESVRYNLAHSLAELGRYAEADAQLQIILDDRETDPDTRRLAADQRRRLEETGGRLDVRLEGAPEDAGVVLDGWAVPAGGWTTPLRVRPGAHTVELVVAGQVNARQEVEAAAGETVEVVLTPLPEPLEAAAGAAEDGAPEPATEPTPRWKDWRTWAIVGGVVAALAIGIGIGVAASGGDGSPSPFPGDLSPGVLTFD